MTTQTIDNIGDLARILREQPEWADTIRGLLLGDELLNLPAQLAEFIRVSQENNRQVREELVERRLLLAQHGEQLARLNELVAQHGEQLTRLNKLVEQHGEQLARINEVMAQHTELLAQHTELLTQHTEILAQHSAQLEQHGEQLAQIREQLAQHTEMLAEHRDQMTELRRRMGRLEGRMGNVEGGLYERGIRAKAVFRAQHILGLENPHIVLTQDSQPAPQLHRALSQAIRSGALSLEQSAEVYDVDLIIAGDDHRYVVIEVSITAEEDDIDRARRRADFLATATGGMAAPALITANLGAVQRAQAAARDVATFLIPYP